MAAEWSVAMRVMARAVADVAGLLMRWWILAFALGVWLAQQQASLFAPPLLAGFGVAALAGAVLAWWLRKKSALAGRRWFAAIGGGCGLLAACGLGFVWAGAWAQWRLADVLPAANEGRDIQIVGVVAGLPQRIERGARFEFVVEQAAAAVPRRISLAWYRGDLAAKSQAPTSQAQTRDDDEEDAAANATASAGPPPLPVHAGERWRFTVRLKRPHGNVNPHGFDYEGWLFERNIRATGYVRPAAGGDSQAERLAAAVWRPATAVEMLRERLRERFYRTLADAPYAGILIALALGDQQAIAQPLWQRFAQTGVTHLMSISGLHVTMFAGLLYALVGWLWRRSSRLPLHLPAQQAATLAGFCAAFAYTLLAGFAVPAQRTLYMLGVVAAARLLKREVAASNVLALALLAVLLLDPWAVLAAGFWLSFGAVALLLYIGSGRLGAAHWLIEWLRAQWAVTLGMLPALLALFQQFSLVSPLANALAIPLVSLIIAPLALLGGLPFFSPALHLAHWLTADLMRYLDWLAAWPLAAWQQAAPPPWQVLLALAGGVWLLLPRGFPARWLGVLAFLPLLTFAPPRPLPGAAQVVVLDVGQGLAVHVQTATHDLLFDAGPMYAADADSGSRIIVPYLRAAGVRELDELIVSHADNDHSGGAASVLASLPVGLLRVSLPREHPLLALPDAPPRLPCRAGQAWAWDDVRFAMLYPPAGLRAKKTNAVSCVLRMTTGSRHLLITADIEATQEAALLSMAASLPRQNNGDMLTADVLLAPHHGSRTSSTAAFIAAVGAREVIFPVGYRNRFGHPKADVVDRYLASGARLHRTDAAGAVSVRLDATGVALGHARDAQPRYWQAGD